MIIQDLIMLGKTVPEEQDDNRIFVCSAGYSPELKKFVRVYPLARRNHPHRWEICQIPLERKPTDSRDESWRINADRSAECHNRINEVIQIKGEIPDSKRGDLMKKMTSHCRSIKEANERRLSLFVLQPVGPVKLTFDENTNSPDHPQIALFDDLFDEMPKGAKRFAFQPRLTFKDEHGSHNLQLRDWGSYEFMRKYGDEKRYEIAKVLALEKSPPLLLGNMNKQRNVWLVIGVFPGQSISKTPLFDFAGIAPVEALIDDKVLV